MKKIILPLIALMLTAANEAFAEKYIVGMKSEITSIQTLSAGTQNELTVIVINNSENAGSNIAVSVYQGEELIGTETIDNLPAGDRWTYVFDDLTIRPITKNTVLGHYNQNVSFKVVVSDGVENIQKDFSFVVLYNGYLGKDYAYPTANPTKRNFSFTGEVSVLVSDADAYCNTGTTSREENWTVDLNGENLHVHKALLYVPYSWDNVNYDGINTWTTSFNGQSITPIASYRDQSNLGNYGSYGYGLVVYDVTELVSNGSNSFALNKKNNRSEIYPSSLIVMVDNPASTPKNVYIVEEADLLSKVYRETEAIYNSSFENVAEGEAVLYVFAAGAQAGEGDLIINEVTKEDIWAGTSKTLDVYNIDVEPGNIAVQFKATGSTILALQQMVVVSGTATAITDVGVSHQTKGDYYDLSGRKLQGKPTKKGVYILNGTKVLVE